MIRVGRNVKREQAPAIGCYKGFTEGRRGAPLGRFFHETGRDGLHFRAAMIKRVRYKPVEGLIEGLDAPAL